MTMTSKSPRPLSASLLAAKGTARPAQRSMQTYGQPRALFDVEKTQPPAPAAQKPTPKVKESATEGAQKHQASGKKASFTFRMDERRHFRLRLLSAHQNRSSQKILEDALDAYLDANAPQTSGLGCPCYQSAGEE